MAALLKNVTNSIWHAFNSLGIDNSGNVVKSKLKVLTANLGTLLDLYGVEKGLEHYRSTATLNFHHYKYYLLKEVFSSLPDKLSLNTLRDYEERIDEVCWLVCKRTYSHREHQILPDECLCHLFRVFCMLGELHPNPSQQDSFQVTLERSEVGLVCCQLVTSLGCEWDQEAYDSLTVNTPGFRFSTFLTLLETKYLSDVEPAVLFEAVTALASTFLCDVIKKGHLMKKGYLLPTLREFWFVLQPTQLAYYKNTDEKEQCGIINLDPNCWVDTSSNRIFLHTHDRIIELAPRDHRSRLQWISSLQIAISQSGGGQGYQRTLACRRRKQRQIDEAESRRKSSIIHDMNVQLQAEKMARVAAELEAQELKVAQEKQVTHLEALLEEEIQAKRDEEIVRALQARVLREEWEKREELEQLQEEQRLLLEQEREKRMEFEAKQKEKEQQLIAAETRLRELEEERQRLDKELQKARDRIFYVEHTVTQHAPKDEMRKSNSPYKVIILLRSFRGRGLIFGA